MGEQKDRPPDPSFQLNSRTMDSAYVQICYEVNQPAYFQMHDFQIGPGTGLNQDQFPSQVQFRSEETQSSIYETSSVDINDIEINIDQ